MSGGAGDPPATGMRVARAVLVAVGAVLVGVGLWTAWTTVPRGQWPSALVWLAGGVVVHDAVLAPLAVALGAWVLPRVPPVWRGPLRGGLLAAGALAVLSVALVAGAADRRHWSVVPQDPVAAIATAVLAVVVGVVVGAFVAGARPSDE
ncbi:hypothetical protein [Cellulosimicrobium marinum]|uniref:hypothetical protein n=1 Tax=Cellulosimicrobium marinum TaxID=1638992 RepID=UPI001E301380|nr:hypothetical protein [Cellulosimicrobium marinum]MCB7135890.1 hypothetical protein [Cellulosimicrobium marinum]